MMPDEPYHEHRGTVVVTGATRGLGLAIAARLANDCFQVIATGRSKSRQFCELEDDRQIQNHVKFAELDLSNHTKIRETARTIEKEHGPILGLVNNAAIGTDGILATMHETQIIELINVNVTGTILLTKYLTRSMLKRRTGRVINVASIIGHTGYSGLSVYAASKSAMLGFTRSLSRELGKAGITVNSVSPGYMETDMTKSMSAGKLATIARRSPMSKLVDVREVAGTVAFLLSEDAKSITGTDIVVDAGSRA
ncbi:SDR family NAD(P)-dependent oxidoreductase [Crateriforma conspicua]|nr:SDR family NAD(P)-dependent oxidoreductase [Crateriforma conspicua]